MFKNLRLILLLNSLILLSKPCFAVTEFVSTINKTGEDYNTLALWEAAMDNAGDITNANCKVFSHGGITGAMPDAGTVTGQISGATGVIIHTTATQILIDTIAVSTFQSGEDVCDDSPTCANKVTLSNTGDAAIITAHIYNDEGDLDGGTTLDGLTTSATQYWHITSPVGERHQGIVGAGATITNSADNNDITNTDANTLIDWLEFDGSGHATSRRHILGSLAADIHHNLFYNNGACNTGAACGVEISAGTWNVSNNLFNNMGGSSERAFGNSGGVGNYVNNTVFDTDIAVYDGGGTSYVYNNFIDDNGADGDALGSCDGGSNNSTNDTTSTAAGCASGAVVNVEMDSIVVAISSNFHLLSTATSVIDDGFDLTTTYSSNFDIDNYDRDAGGVTWDIGFDEFIPSATQSVGRRRIIGIN